MPEQTLKQKTAKGLFWGGLSNGAQQVLNLLFGLVLARILDASDYGMVGMLAIFSAIAGTLQDSGFSTALINKKEIKKEDYNAVFWFSVLSSATLYIILFFCAPLIADFFEKPALTQLARVIFLGFFFSSLGISSSAYLTKTLMVKERAKSEVIGLLCSGIVGVTFAIKGYAYMAIAFQTLVYVSVISAIKIYYSPWKPSFKIDLTPLKSMFGFSSKLLFTNIFVQINSNIFSVVLGKFYSAAQLGFYSQGQKWMAMGNQSINGMISTISQPVLVDVNEDKDRQAKVFRKMVRFGAFISFPTMFGLGFVAKEFIEILLGTKWLPSVPFLQLFCLWGGFSFLWTLYTSLLISHGKSNLYMYGMIFTGALQLLSVVAMFKFGIFPMVIGYILVNFLTLLFWHHHTSRILPLSIKNILKDTLPYFVIIAFSIAVAYFAVGHFDNMYIIIALKILIVAALYSGIVWMTGSTIMKEAVGFIRHKQEINSK